jgi:hypothetical protein
MELKLKAGREEEIYLQDKVIDDIAKQEPKPAHFTGTIIVRDAENREIGKQPIIYFAGGSPAKVINVDPKAKPIKDERSEAEKFIDAQFDTRLAFVRDQRGTTDAATRTRRIEVLAALRKERPADAAPVFEQALDAVLVAGLAGDSWPKAKPSAGNDAGKGKDKDKEKEKEEETVKPASIVVRSPAVANPVIALLDDARKLAQPDAVAQYFGAPPATVTGDLTARPAWEREKKRMTTQRDMLAKIERLRADVLRATGQWDAAWKAFAQIKRWEAEPTEKPTPAQTQTRAIEAAMLEQNGHLGLALDALNARLKGEAADKKLLTQRLAVYEKLGWTDIAARERVRLAMFEQQKKVAGKL